MGLYETGFVTLKIRGKRGTCRENVQNSVCHTAKPCELRCMCFPILWWQVCKNCLRQFTYRIEECLWDTSFLHRWAVNTVSHELLSALLPGAVTAVLERKDSLNPDLNPSKRTIGIRVPDHPFLLRLAQELGGPIALTSANISNERSTLSVAVSWSIRVGVVRIVDVRMRMKQTKSDAPLKHEIWLHETSLFYCSSFQIYGFVACYVGPGHACIADGDCL